MKPILGAALGGALGSVCRYGLARWLYNHNPHPDFSLGILAANLVGCFLMGFLAVKIQALDPEVQAIAAAFLLTGFLGGLTTYSTYMLELFRLGQAGAWKLMSLYLGTHLTVGMAALWAGISLAKTSSKV